MKLSGIIQFKSILLKAEQMSWVVKFRISVEWEKKQERDNGSSDWRGMGNGENGGEVGCVNVFVWNY